MGTSAVFVGQQQNGHRITLLVEEPAQVDALRESLLDAGFAIESIEVGLDTAWDVAATCPDLVIVHVASEGAQRSARGRLHQLRAHPRLRLVPVILCTPRGVRPFRIPRTERAHLEVREEPLAGTVLRELAGHPA
jgi:hypothetical protein